MSGVAGELEAEVRRWHEPTKDLTLGWSSHRARYLAMIGLVGAIAASVMVLDLIQIPAAWQGRGSGGLAAPAAAAWLGAAALLATLAAVAAPAARAPRVLAGVLWFVAGVVVPFQDFLGGLREHAFKLDTLLLLVGWLAVRRRVGAAWASGLAVWVVGAILWQAGLLYRLIDPMWLAAHVSFMSSGRAADIVPAEIVTAAVLLAPTVSGAWVAVWVDRAVRPRREAVRARREAVRQARTAAPSAPILAAAPARAGAVAARTDPFAVVSLVLAVVGLSVPAVVFGHLARSRIGESGDEGAGLATAGLVVGYVVLGLSVLAVVGLLVLPHMLGPGH